MQVSQISNQSFEAKKFRLPIRKIHTKWGDKSVDCVKEFDNPRAEELYNLAQHAESTRKQINLFSEIGNYKIINKYSETLINNFLNRKLP